MKAKHIIPFVLSFALLGCATPASHVPNPTSLEDLENLSYTSSTSSESSFSGSKIRMDALKETAMTIGAQGGLAWRAKQINKESDKQKAELSRIFNFNGLLLDNSILPPVLRESKQSLAVEGPSVIRTADRTYKIVKQAQFVTTAPDWREYLWLNYQTPELPDRTLLPRNTQERQIWHRYVDLGWQKGVEQANNIYADNLARIQSDFKGMVLYKKLLAQNMVSKPFMSTSTMGITKSEDNTELRIDDRILRITANPEFNTQSQEWNPALIHEQ